VKYDSFCILNTTYCVIFEYAISSLPLQKDRLDSAMTTVMR